MAMNDPRQWSFDVDRYLNRLVPLPPWRRIPYPAARFLGYRHEDDKPREAGNLAPILWAFIGIFCSVALIAGLGMHIPDFTARSAPLIVGSFGAAAVLEFYAIESPLAQPRNAILGQLISCVVGVGVCKLFLLSDDFERLRWLGGSIACAAATAFMALTKTVHPPAGATALLAVTDDAIIHLGWFLLPMVMLGCTLMLVVALLVNNVGRRFPLYWWTPEELRPGKKEMFHRRPSSSSTARASAGEEEPKEDVEAQAGADVEPEAAGPRHHRVPETNEILIRPTDVFVPEHMFLTQEEKLLLESMCQRL